jgi:hypothetical protein
MAQPVFADRVILPPNSTGTPTGWFAAAVAGGTLYLPGTVLTDAAGNSIDAATGAPAGTERGLIVRPIPSGTQAVSLAAVPTVTEKQDQTANVATTWTSASALNTTTATYAATGYGTANVGIRVPTTVTAGAVTIEVSQDGTDWVPAGAVRQDNSYPENPIPLAYFPGTNGTRIYALSVDAFTLIRVKLSTVIVGAGNVVITISAVAGGIEPVVATRVRKTASYRAVFRATTRPYRLSNAFTANTRKQYATIHHAAASTRTVRLQRVQVVIVANTVAAANLSVDLIRITTAPVTGAPAITPAPTDGSDVVAEATCLALPGTAATEAGGPLGTGQWALGITGALPTTNPPPTIPPYDLWLAGGDDMKAPTIRAGVLEGFAVTIDADSASTVAAFVVVEFTEEGP